MDPNDVASLLAFASAVDPRVRRNEPEQRQAQVIAWTTLLQDVDPADARAAIARHYSQAGAGAVLPGDIRQAARGSEADRHPSSRLLRQAVAEADLATAAAPVPALPAGPQGRRAAEEAKTRLDEALARISAKWAAPAATGYVPKRQRPTGPRRRPAGLPTHDRQGHPLTVCHRCACDIPAPDGWDPADRGSSPLFCDPCAPDREAAL